MLWNVSVLYARLYAWVKDRTGKNVKGFGRFLTLLRTDREFEACGLQWFFDHRIASAYMRLIGGSYNEPETHKLLRALVSETPARINFIDVGANIGEMVLAMAAQPGVTRVICFEPHPICSEVIRKHLVLNGFDKVEIHSALVGDGSLQPYVINSTFAPISGIQPNAKGVAPTRTVRLDDKIDVNGNCILLIDVEGAELDVLRGAVRLIESVRPLIIFEHNYVNRTRYSLNDVRDVLGPEYTLLRLRTDGWLDQNLDDTWNVVAVPSQSIFEPVIRRLVA
jgi:FkbM family methyltransferase